MASILLALNEKSILTVISFYFERMGLIVNSCSSSNELLATIDRIDPKIVVLDEELPGNIRMKDICFNLKGKSRTKNINIILASKSDQKGNPYINDYILKPFVPSELMSKVKKFAEAINVSSTNIQNKTLEYRGIEMNVNSFRVSRDGRNLQLGPTEFKILQCFLELPGKILSREHIMNQVWGYNSNIEPRTIDVHINRLRLALKDPSEKDSIIRTIRSAGYSLNITSDAFVRIQ